MANGINKAILIGNVGKDPEVKVFGEGKVKASFPLATHRRYKDNNEEWQTKTEWHNIVLWNGTAKLAEKCIQKGQEIYVEGPIQTRSFDDDSGKKRYITEINGKILRPYLGNQVNRNPETTQEDAIVDLEGDEEVAGG